ncbi:MAG TPA: hypothetical protein VGP73_21135 [Thermoanaerobaculia bacterium]
MKPAVGVPGVRTPHSAAVRSPLRPAVPPAGTVPGVAQPFLGAIVGAAGSLASYVPTVAVVAGAAYLANTLTERQTGRNIVGHLSYYGQDPVVQEVMDMALQNGIKPFSTQVFNNYSFKIDRFCRTYEVSGYVSRRTYNRVQGAIAPLVKAAGDQNGHIVADSLNGPPHAVNFIGMTAHQNNAVGAALDDDTYSRLEGAVRRIVDNEERYFDDRRRTYVNYDRVWIQVKLSYPAWNATSRDTKLNYFRPTRLDVRMIGYTGSGQSREFDNPYLPNAQPGHLGVRDIRLGGEFDNTVVGGPRYLIGDLGYP